MKLPTGTLRNLLRSPLSPQSACFLPALRLNGMLLAWAQKGPKTAQDHQKHRLMALRRAPAGTGVPVHGQNPLGQRVGCLFVAFCPFSPINDVGWHNLGMVCALQSKTENWAGWTKF